MDVSNASLYDGGSAAAEAVLMAMSVTGRPKKVGRRRAACIPNTAQILETYLASIGARTGHRRHARRRGESRRCRRRRRWRDGLRAGAASEFFRLPGRCDGDRQDRPRRRRAACASFDPISLGLLKRPGDFGADIVVAEGQSLGTPHAFGGPYLGIMACREQFVRRMPGRIAGQTVDRRGRRCWVLTLQTREQHIRREKATSNICTNKGLFALRAAVYLAEMGPQGLRETAELCLQKAHYARQQHCRRLATHRSRSTQPTFKEFVVRDSHGRVAELLEQASDAGYLAGMPLGRWYPRTGRLFPGCRDREADARREIDGLAEVLSARCECPLVAHALSSHC